MSNTILRKASVALALAVLCASPGSAQAPSASKSAPAVWWRVAKAKGGVYTPPMRPLWKLSDLKKMHAGQANWQETIIKDVGQEATYNSAAPGTKFTSRMHQDTATLFVVVAGQVHFNVQGQQPVTATRGSVVNIMRNTLYSYDVEGVQNALWLEIDPADYKSVYPATGPVPPPGSGRQYVMVTPNKFIWAVPGAYTAPNRLHFNTFDLAAHCLPGIDLVLDDHIGADAQVKYFDPADNKCSTGISTPPNKSRAEIPPPKEPFNSHAAFGHLHIGQAEWFLVQGGSATGWFENAGKFIAQEGDVLYVPPSTWHRCCSVTTTPPPPHGVPLTLLLLGTHPLYNMMHDTTGQ